MSLVFSEDVILAGLLDIWPGFLSHLICGREDPVKHFFPPECQMVGEDVGGWKQ